jgi:hypothetical protein
LPYISSQVSSSPPPLTWEEFEMKLKSDSPICYHDIPWPSLSHPIINLSKGASAKESKNQIRSALIRWHPDKFQKILSKIDDAAERLKAVHMVQEVARKIITEKESLGC